MTKNRYDKLIPFCRKLVRKYAIPLCNVVGHSDVAPARKADPGPAFPWKRLAREDWGYGTNPKMPLKWRKTIRPDC
ncbi:MAG: N-acetylmuramoyl-L-alanine amidase [Alphaproteobacteria bacterium]